MGRFRDIFKRKPGGTPLGNTIRGVLNKASGGILGNGLFKLEEGQTMDDRVARDAQLAGVAMSTIEQENLKNEFAKEVEKAGKKDFFKSMAFKVGAGILSVGLLVFGIVKATSGNKKRRR